MSEASFLRARRHAGMEEPQPIVPLPLRNATRSDVGMQQEQHFLLIWLDQTINERNAKHRKGITRLQQINNNIRTFTDGQKCIQFIEAITDTKVWMIVSGSLGERFIPFVHHLQHVESLFIFCRDRIRHEAWSRDWPKIKGIFTTMTPIYDALKEAVYQQEQNAVSISFMTTSRDLNQLDPSFMYTQILKEILLTIKFEQKHIRDFIKYSRRTFANDAEELATIRELEKSYRKKTPISWYTRSCYLYSMLNRSLRLMDGDILTRMGFFINDLHRHIQQLHTDQYTDQSSGTVFTVYRGQQLSKVEFEQMCKTMGGLMSFNNFLSTSKAREVALNFVEKATNDTNLVRILFVMTIDPSQSRTPFASIKTVSDYREEEEVLFSMHTVFRIDAIEQMDGHDRLYTVSVTLTSDDDRQLGMLTELVRQTTYPASEGWYRLGLILFKMGHFSKAEEIFQVLLKQASNSNDKGAIYYQLGRAKDAQGKYRKAIDYYEKGIKIYNAILSPNDLKLAEVYNERGNAYFSMERYTKALSSHVTALRIQQKSLHADHQDLATSYNSIGNIHYTVRDYARALSSYEEALEIHQQLLPHNHPDLAVSYMAVGNVHSSLCHFDKALAAYETALYIRQQSLPPKHPAVAASYNNIGVVYERMGDYAQAQSFYERAVEMTQQSLPPDHHDVQICRENLDRVKNRR